MSQISNVGYASIEQMADAAGRNKSNKVSAEGYNGVSFAEVLSQKCSIEQVIGETGSLIPIKFSKHASARLEERDIQLTDEQMSRLEEGTAKAGSKGIKESLVLLDNMAFIINTQNKTVITAMDQNMNEENIFTNIDGAVII
ncbi:MAG: TIGR02530 family flagellar biosynthesis protein [Eubacteriales bacterium]|nr:TIGR02530 family flagellar biosynthesis protein [Eubacteriales bacterium]